MEISNEMGGSPALVLLQTRWHIGRYWLAGLWRPEADFEFVSGA